MAAKEKPQPTGRPIVLKSRQATFREFKTKTEATGQDRSPYAEVDVELTVADTDRDQILVVDGEGGASQLWNGDQQPILAELEGWLTLNWQAQGLVTLGPIRGEQTKFPDAVMHAVKVKLELGGSMQMRATLRVDSEGEAELLQRLKVAGLCKLSFKGAKLIPVTPGEDDQPDLLDGDRDDDDEEGDDRGSKAH